MAKRSKVYPAQVPPLPLRPSRAGMSKRLRRRLTVLLAVAIALIVVGSVLSVVLHHDERLLKVGAQAPAFPQLPKGAALVEFCATWSSPCAQQAPALNGLPGLVSVNADSEDAASVRSFERNHGLEYRIVLDHGPKVVHFPTRGPRGPLAARYHVTELPTAYVLDPSGRVAWRAAGIQPRAVLERELRRAARRVP